MTTGPVSSVHERVIAMEERVDAAAVAGLLAHVAGTPAAVLCARRPELVPTSH